MLQSVLEQTIGLHRYNSFHTSSLSVLNAILLRLTMSNS